MALSSEQSDAEQTCLNTFKYLHLFRLDLLRAAFSCNMRRSAILTERRGLGGSHTGEPPSSEAGPDFERREQQPAGGPAHARGGGGGSRSPPPREGAAVWPGSGVTHAYVAERRRPESPVGSDQCIW